MKTQPKHAMQDIHTRYWTRANITIYVLEIKNIWLIYYSCNERNQVVIEVNNEK